MEHHIEAVRALPLDDDLLLWSSLTHAELLHDGLALRGIEVLEQRRNGHHVVQEPLPIEVLQRRDHLGILAGQLAQHVVGHLEDLGVLLRDDVRRARRAREQRHLAEERALAEVRERELLPVGGALADPDPPFDDDEKAPSGVALANDDLAGNVAVVAQPVHQGDEGVLRKVVEQRHLLRVHLRRALFGRDGDVAESAIEVLVLGGHGRRRGRPRTCQLLVGGDGEQLDFLFDAAGKQVRDGTCLAYELLARDDLFVVRRCDQVLRLEGEDGVIGQRLRLRRRQKRIEIDPRLRLGRQRSDRALLAARRRRRRLVGDLRFQLAAAQCHAAAQGLRAAAQCLRATARRRRGRHPMVELERLVVSDLRQLDVSRRVDDPG